MDKTANNNTESAFSYEAFDRQLAHFCMMLKMLIYGWEDYSSQEMTFDINSLCTKASRLCYLADQDLAQQHTDIAHQRKKQNEANLDTFEMLVHTDLIPFLHKVIEGIKLGKKVEGHKSPTFASDPSAVLPKLRELLESDGMTTAGVASLNTDMQEIEKIFLKKIKVTKFPGVRFEERLWNLLRLYTMVCYLLLHFRRVCHVVNTGMGTENAGRLMELAIQKYMDEEGSEKLELYFSNLQYDNDGHTLSEEQLLQARRELKNIVPPCFQIPFLNHADDIRTLGTELAGIHFTVEEFKSLLEAMAKYTLITQKIYEMRYPEDAIPTLQNEVFYPVVNNHAVDMTELKKSIAKMVALVTKKNHWFCVWSVLKHHNLIKLGTNFSAFANQMMSEDWFGDIDPRYHFTGDNLSDYSHYFAEYDYTQWDKEMFLEKKALFGMKKWSEKLFDTFSSLCREMEKSIWGYRFLG